MKFKYCLVQYLMWQTDGRKKKKLLECKDCPIRNKCEKKGENNDT